MNSIPEWDRILSASQKNKPEQIWRMVTYEGVDPSHANGVGQSALHIAALWGHVESVHVLISLGADLDAQNRITGGTPLHCVAQSTKKPVAGRIQSAILLMDAGADPSKPDNYGKAPADYAEDGEVAESPYLEAKYPDIRGRSIKQVLLDGLPSLPLFDFIHNGDVSGLEKYCKTNNKKKAFETMLDSANGNKDPVSVIVDSLIAQSEGVDSGISVSMETLSSILEILLREGYFEAEPTEIVDKPLRELCQTINHASSSTNNNKNATTTYLQTACKVILQFRNTSSAPKPLANSIINLLHDASRWENVHMIEFMVHTIGVDVNTPGKQGLTPLHFACRSGRFEAAKVLVKLGADTAATDDRGKTPLDAAIANRKDALVEFLNSCS